MIANLEKIKDPDQLTRMLVDRSKQLDTVEFQMQQAARQGDRSRYLNLSSRRQQLRSDIERLQTHLYKVQQTINI